MEQAATSPSEPLFLEPMKLSTKLDPSDLRRAFWEVLISDDEIA